MPPLLRHFDRGEWISRRSILAQRPKRNTCFEWASQMFPTVKAVRFAVIRLSIHAFASRAVSAPAVYVENLLPFDGDTPRNAALCVGALCSLDPSLKQCPAG